MVDENWVPFLQKVTADQELHARWLNTLALMEHIGSRKMLKALDSSALNLTTLEHIAEETRHAVFFKGLSSRVAGKRDSTFEDHELFCGRESRTYFQSLDQCVADWLATHQPAAPAYACYLCVTALIEARATELYKQYEEVLSQNGFPFSLRSVLLEEEKHLAEMQEAFHEAQLPWNATVDTLRQHEALLFADWFRALHSKVEAQKIAEQESDDVRHNPQGVERAHHAAGF